MIYIFLVFSILLNIGFIVSAILIYKKAKDIKQTLSIVEDSEVFLDFFKK